jgi:hypothetical protein
LVDEVGRTQTITAEQGYYRLELPPATCSDGDCFIGGPPRLIVESAPLHQRQPLLVQPTLTPIPTPLPNPIQVLAVSPRRQVAFYTASLIGFAGALGLLWWAQSKGFI